MTDEDKKSYNKLNAFERDLFDTYVKHHPGCSFQEALNNAKFSNEISTEITTQTQLGNQDINTTLKDPKRQKAIIQRIADWYNKNAKHIWVKVQDSFENVLNYLDNLIARGVKWIGDKIDDVIDWAGDKIDDGIEWLIDLFS
jgi:hypothetical protein